MLIDKNTKRVTLENVEIKRIMSEGGVLWEKMFRWRKYRFDEWLELGKSSGFLFESEMKSRYPGYEEYKLRSLDGYGYLIYGKIKGTDKRGKGKFIEEVQSDNENAYPKSGANNGYWYEFIN